MDKQKIKTKVSTYKNVCISMRITKDLSQWLKKNEYSPTGIFLEACNDLGYGK